MTKLEVLRGTELSAFVAEYRVETEAFNFRSTIKPFVPLAASAVPRQNPHHGLCGLPSCCQHPSHQQVRWRMQLEGPND